MEQSNSSVVESSRVLVPRQRNDEQQCRCCAGERKENFVLMIVTNATDCIRADQMSKVDQLMNTFVVCQ